MNVHSLPDHGRSNRSVSTTTVAHMHLPSNVAKPEAGLILDCSDRDHGFIRREQSMAIPDGIERVRGRPPRCRDTLAQGQQRGLARTRVVDLAARDGGL